MQNDQVGDKVIEFNDLGLFMSKIFLNSPVVVEKYPLEEVVELFTFARRSIHRFP